MVLLSLAYTLLWSTCQNLIMFQPTKLKKQLPLPNHVKKLSTNTTTTSHKRASTIPDMIVKRFCQLMLDEHSSSVYQIMDIILSGQGSFVRGTSDLLINFQFSKNSTV